jgi:hypothetical protein
MTVSVVQELVLKTAFGGALVLVFALFAQTLTPKRFAGVFAAAPTVALTSLAVTVGVKGTTAAARGCTGMIAGGVGFVVYCLLAPATVRRWGALRGSAVTLLAWTVTAAALLPGAAALPAAKTASALPAARGAARSGTSGRPALGMDLDKLAQTKASAGLVRFGFGAGTSLIAGLVSVAAGPVVGGVFLAFPAILLASLTLVADEEGQAAARDDARGAIAGGLGLVGFAAAGAATFATVRAPAAFSAACGAWLLLALAAYGAAWLTGHGGDEPRPQG